MKSDRPYDWAQEEISWCELPTWSEARAEIRALPETLDCPKEEGGHES